MGVGAEHQALYRVILAPVWWSLHHLVVRQALATVSSSPAGGGFPPGTEARPATGR